MKFDEKFKEYFPKLYTGHQKMMSDISNIGYVSLDDYKQDLVEVNEELEQVELTINYYKDRRRVLNDWKHMIEVKIGKYNEEVVCGNCKFFNQRNMYCSKCKSGVVAEASCDDFEWR